MTNIIGITEEKREFILSKIIESEKLLNESMDTLRGIGKSEEVFDKIMNPLQKIREGIDGLSQAKSDIKRIQSDLEAKEKIRKLEIWFNSPQNNISSLKGKNFCECWQLLIL